MRSTITNAGILHACLLGLIMPAGLASGSQAATVPAYTVLYGFGASAGDGFGPATGLTLTPGGALFGVNQGGPANNGTVFEVTPPVAPAKAWGEATIYDFGANNRLGTHVTSRLSQGANGTLTGSSFFGGSTKNGPGTVFMITPPAAQGASWTGHLVHEFAATGGIRRDGVYPDSSVVRSASHQLYGTTLNGGACNLGSAYQLTYQPAQPSGYAWAESLFSFPCDESRGSHPSGPLVAIGQTGTPTLYGAATRGGASGFGAIFKLVPPKVPGGSWSSAAIYSFAGGADGAYPAGIICDGAGGLFGVIASDPGNVFHVVPPATPGARWTNAILHSFVEDGVDGWQPNSDLYLSETGELFGTTQFGGGAACGNIGCGTIFRLSPPATPGGHWNEAILYRFTGAADGGVPQGGLVRDSAGIFYGTASDYGPFNRGVVFKFLP